MNTNDHSHVSRRRTMKTNIYSPCWIIKAALPHLQPGASIIATTSEQAYDTAKAPVGSGFTLATSTAITRVLEEASFEAAALAYLEDFALSALISDDHEISVIVGEVGTALNSVRGSGGYVNAAGHARGCLMERNRPKAVFGSVSVLPLELEIEWTCRARSGETPATKPKAVGLEATQIKVHMDGDAPAAVLRAFINHAVLWAPVANTLHAPVQLDVWPLFRWWSRDRAEDYAVGHLAARGAG